MTISAVSAKSFLEAMKLPDDQRRAMLESLGAKIMDQLSSDRDSPQSGAFDVRLSPKSA